MAAQAKRVHDLTVARNAVRQAHWRTIEVLLAPYELPQEETAAAALSALEAALARQRREAARPLPHRFELVPAR
jgi:hypothetical protein